jgi:arylsulfatase A-like enzyme
MAEQKPNILFIMGDDIGWYNISAYNLGVMGYRTPNIDRIAREGALFTDWYGQQSCTAGRAAFITGQSPIRTGLTKVGLPGADIGLRAEDPTVGDVMKSLGYATGQFGKNHLGDRNEFLPTVHGFDEFFGNLYHSMRKKNRRTRTTQRVLNSESDSAPGVCCTAGLPTKTILPKTCTTAV